MRTFRYHIVDVFAETPLAGNQLAVFTEAGGLSGDDMQRLARETNYSETTFVGSPELRDGGYDVRIFTPREEVPFAGHPTLGTAWVLRQELIGRPVPRVVLNLKVGPIPVDFEDHPSGRIDRLWMHQRQPTFGRAVDRAEIAAVLGLTADDVLSEFPVEEVSTGLPFVIVPLRSLDAVRRARVQRDRLFALIDRLDAKALLIFTRQTYAPDNQLNVRVFADYFGAPEDPATGSANGGLAAYLARHRYFGGPEIDIRVEQGHEIARPSLLYLRAREHGDRIDVSVGGRVQPAATGEFRGDIAAAPPEVVSAAAPGRSHVARALRPFGTTIFTEMTLLAERHGAINLAQGFPDFDGPPGIVDAAVDALRAGHNQYAHSAGAIALRRAIAAHQAEHYGLTVDPAREVSVFCGATEAIASAILGLINPGDEVILIEPFYDSYRACVALAGGVPRFVTLRAPGFALEPDALAAAFSARTRAVLLNTPHNPTGRVFRREELEAVARLCRERDVVAISDEVYEHITFGGARHVPIATLPGMAERTLTISSTGKTFSMTGWKVGWASGPAHLVAAAQAAHQYLTFCGAAPLQVAMSHALGRGDYLTLLQREYAERRDLLVGALRDAGFRVTAPEGAYFAVADFSQIRDDDDWTFARHLVENIHVAAVPMSVFYREGSPEGRRLLRFAFCKRTETLRAAADRLIRGVAAARRTP